MFVIIMPDIVVVTGALRKPFQLCDVKSIKPFFSDILKYIFYYLVERHELTDKSNGTRTVYHVQTAKTRICLISVFDRLHRQSTDHKERKAGLYIAHAYLISYMLHCLVVFDRKTKTAKMPLHVQGTSWC